MTPRQILSAALIACGLLAGSRASSAALVTLNAIASGSYHQNGSFTIAGNYAAGYFNGSPPGELRDYFTFDLTGISGTITSATVRVFQPQTGFSSSDPSETFAIFDVSTPLATLTSNVGSVPVFNDLGTGTTYGSIAINGVPSNGTIDIPLNAAALTFFNATHAPLAIGGAITTISASPTQSERTFNSSDGTMTRQLILEVVPVPEPASLLIIGMGAAAMLLRRRRA